MRNASQAELLRRITGYLLLVTGGLIVLFNLPLWFWLAALGSACLGVGWCLVGRK